MYGLLDGFYEVFYGLALANLRRATWLAAAPRALAFWALEDVNKQCEAALQFMHVSGEGGGGGQGLRFHCSSCM